MIRRYFRCKFDRLSFLSCPDTLKRFRVEAVKRNQKP